MLRKLAYLLAGLVFLLAVVVVAGRCYVGRAEADPSRDAVLPGLHGPVEVWRDSLGVPHVWAQDDEDLFRAVGYVHAQDRLWQMELFRRVADGRMAEVLGAPLVSTDRFLRTVGMGRSAGETERTLDPESRRMLQAYADGVNDWIDHHPGPLPPSSWRCASPRSTGPSATRWPWARSWRGTWPTGTWGSTCSAP